MGCAVGFCDKGCNLQFNNFEWTSCQDSNGDGLIDGAVGICDITSGCNTDVTWDNQGNCVQCQ